MVAMILGRVPPAMVPVGRVHPSPGGSLSWRSGARPSIAWSSALFVVTFARGALASSDSPPDGDCTVTLSPDHARGPWRAAVTALEPRLRGGLEAGFDCRAIVVALEGDGAVLIFTTRDGRQALRRLRSPDELLPVVDALRVTLEPIPSPPASGPSRVPAAPEAVEPPRATPSETRTGLFLEITAGGRLSEPGAFASSSLAMRGGAALRGWELIVFAEWDPQYAIFAGEEPPAFSMSRYAAGVGVGRRVVFGAGEFAFGMKASMAIAQEYALEDEPVPPGASTSASSQSAAEPTAGPYLGILWPRGTVLRMRADLSLDAVVSRLGQPLSLDDSLPSLPWWSSMFTLGMEWEVP